MNAEKELLKKIINFLKNNPDDIKIHEGLGSSFVSFKGFKITFRAGKGVESMRIFFEDQRLPIYDCYLYKIYRVVNKILKKHIQNKRNSICFEHKKLINQVLKVL